MGKYLELFRGEVGDLTEKTKPENKPYVAYSTKEGRVVYTVVPAKDPVVEGPADNEIWYTSTDGNVVSLFYNDSTKFGANVISNTYNNGNGVITFDGPVTIIGWSAFDSFYATNIILPNSVKSIEGWAFVGAGTLKSVTIPNGVTNIGPSPFAYIFHSLYVSYKGTMEQWNLIEKVPNWNQECPEITVHCTDGDIIIPAN